MPCSRTRLRAYNVARGTDPSLCLFRSSDQSIHYLHLYETAQAWVIRQKPRVDEFERSSFLVARGAYERKDMQGHSLTHLHSIALHISHERWSLFLLRILGDVADDGP